MRSLPLAVLGAAGLLAAADRSVAVETIYQVGNSLTWDSQPHRTEQLAANAGMFLEIGYHILSGASLAEVYEAPQSILVGSVDPFGSFDNALPNYDWDALTFQPFTDPLANLQQDEQVIKDLVALAESDGRNADSTLYVYAGWPFHPDWDTWDDPVTNSPTQPTVRSAAYAETLVENLRTTYGERVKLIPVGHVLNALRQEIEAGAYSEFTTISNVYRDVTHLSDEHGRFLASTTVFATVTGTSPVGLEPPAVWSDLSSIEELQQLVWDVVTRHPLTGVVGRPSGDFNGDGSIDLADFDVWFIEAGLPELRADANGDLKVDQLDYEIWQRYATAPTSEVDYNGNGEFDEGDLAIFWQQFGATGASPADGNGDGVVDGSDYATLRNAISYEVLSKAADFNDDGVVDLVDLAIWEAENGSVAQLSADANSDNVVDIADYEIWLEFYGGPPPPVAATAAPEPASILVLLSALVGAGLANRRR